MCVLLLSSGRTPSLGQTSKLLRNFFVNVKCSLFVELNLFSCTSNSNCSCYCKLNLFLYIELNVFHSTLQRVSKLRQRVLFWILTSWEVLSVALSSMHTPWRVLLFCILHSLQEHHCILYQESALICRLWALQLWNTVAHINPVIMSCLTF